MNRYLAIIASLTAIIMVAAVSIACNRSQDQEAAEQSPAVVETPQNTDPADKGQDVSLFAPQDLPGAYVSGEELLCLADSKEEAQKIADMYGIELVKYGMGVATFHTEEDPYEVIARGKKEGYPELSLNGISTIMDVN